AAKLEALQLVGLRARQLGDVLDGAGIFVRRDGRLDVVLQHLGRGRIAAVAWAQHDIGLDDLPALLVGRAHHAAFGHRRVLEQRRLYFGTRDVVARRNDHVVGARLVPEIAVGIHEVSVAGDVPAVLHVLVLAFAGEIAAPGRPAHGEAADGVGRNLLALGVDHARLVTRHRLAGGARANLAFGRADEDVQHFGRADAVEDLDAGRGEPGVERRLGQGFAG